jgi:hypothetical protein
MASGLWLATCYLLPATCNLSSFILILTPVKDTVTTVAIVLGHQQELAKKGHELGLPGAAMSTRRVVRDFGWLLADKFS